ncbi:MULTISPECIES: hypothetical protein [unclassified Shewanella]|uniref:hypothetical protein n=1 Tax=unclassified Shewanella TaxID=196818 RepID=UPI0021D8B1C1|nr:MULTISPECIES: hypothetical protein [unclassified Shewanella]MCU8045545.1 hypothetical protein [Shewanella sp. SM68]MCU8046347.1 hypothetical protein [Shewanella sp. SM65]
MNIELSNKTPSVFGNNYWAKFKTAGIDIIPPLQQAVVKGYSLDDAAYREFWLEVFRIGHPELKKLSLKSRLNSFFVAESIDDARRYISRNGFTGEARIFKVKSQDSGLKLDMTWLDQKFPRDFREFGYYYLSYWKGMRIDDDPHLKAHEKRGSLLEILLDGKVEIGEAVA